MNDYYSEDYLEQLNLREEISILLGEHGYEIPRKLIGEIIDIVIERTENT